MKGALAADMPRPSVFPTIIVEWGDPHQLGHFLLVEDA
jgi:hypothetical protein